MTSLLDSVKSEGYAEGFAAGVRAMREAAAKAVCGEHHEGFPHGPECDPGCDWPETPEHTRECDAIRSLPDPEAE